MGSFSHVELERSKLKMAMRNLRCSQALASFFDETLQG